MDSSSSISLATTDSNDSTTITQQTLLVSLSDFSKLITIKLDQSSYILWKCQITSVLDAYSLLNFVDRSQPCPSRENPLYQQWFARDRAVLMLIHSTLSHSALSLVVGQSTACGAWEVIERHYTSVLRLNMLNLKTELYNIKKNNDSISLYLQRIKEIRDKLAVVGVEVDIEEILHIILKGLPHEYRPFCSAMRTRNKSISFVDIHVLLTSEEQFLEYSNETSFSVQGNIGHGRSNPSRRRGRSFNNGNQGGFNYYSQSYYKSYNQSGQGFSQRPICQICGRIGHIALDCFHRMDFSYQGKQPPSKLAAMASTPGLSSTQFPTQSYLVLDIGATYHYTLDLDTISDHQDYKGYGLVTVGNGQSLPIIHIGNSQLKASSNLFHLCRILQVPSMNSNLLSDRSASHIRLVVSAVNLLLRLFKLVLAKIIL